MTAMRGGRGGGRGRWAATTVAAQRKTLSKLTLVTSKDASTQRAHRTRGHETLLATN